VCREGGWDVLKIVKKAAEEALSSDVSHKLYSRKPEEITRDIVANLYGKAGEELI
jgi:hypothetical protein